MNKFIAKFEFLKLFDVFFCYGKYLAVVCSISSSLCVYVSIYTRYRDTRMQCACYICAYTFVYNSGYLYYLWIFGIHETNTSNVIRTACGHIMTFGWCGLLLSYRSKIKNNKWLSIMKIKFLYCSYQSSLWMPLLNDISIQCAFPLR